MAEDYQRLVLETYKAQLEVIWDLLYVAQRLSPGTWPLQLTISLGEHQEHIFRACVSNGDDNVTAEGKNPGAALAKLIGFLLDGSVFPLTGNMGVYYRPDFEDTPEGKQYYALRMAVKEVPDDKLRERVIAILNGQGLEKGN